MTQHLGRGERIVSIKRLRGSHWHASHVVTIGGRSGDTYDLIIRRWARAGWDREDADFDAHREAAVLRLVQKLPVSTPLLIAADTRAEVSDVPALLMTRVAGGPPPPAQPGDFVQQLADALVAIHALDSAGHDIPPYRRWVDRARLGPAPWMAREPHWQELCAIARTPEPDAPLGFIHRDYHAGNTLWVGSQLSGVVDWSTGSVGPVSVDIARMRWNLAMEAGPELADDFLAAYQAAAGSDLGYHRYWDIADLIDGVASRPAAPDPPTRARLEEYAKQLLG